MNSPPPSSSPPPPPPSSSPPPPSSSPPPSTDLDTLAYGLDGLVNSLQVDVVEWKKKQDPPLHHNNNKSPKNDPSYQAFSLVLLILNCVERHSKAKYSKEQIRHDESQCGQPIA